MTKPFLIFLFLFFQTAVYAIDSLLLTQKLEKLEQVEGVQKLNLLSELSVELQTENNSQARAFGEEALALAASLGDSIKYYEAVSNLAVVNNIDGQYEESILLQNKALRYHQRMANEKEEAKSLKILGTIYTHSGNYEVADSIMSMSEFILNRSKDNSVGLMDLKLEQGINFLDWAKYPSAEKAFKEALDLSIAIKDTATMVILWNNLGIVARRQSDLKKALEYYFQAELHHKPSDFFKAKIYNNIGIIYKTMGNFEKSLEFYQKSLAIKEKLKLQRSISFTLHNIGTLYKQKLDYGEALKYYNRSLDIKNQLKGSNNGLTKTLNNIGNVYLLLGKYEEAEIYYQKHLKVSEAEKNNDEVCRALNNLSALYIQKENYQDAITYGLRSLEIAEEINYPRIIRSSSENLSKCYKAIGDSYKHLFYQNQFWVVNDSMLNKESILEISKLEHKYERSHLAQNILLENEQLKNLESQRKNRRLKTMLIASLIFLCLLLFGILAYWAYQYNLAKAQQKLNSKLEKSNLQIELLEEKISHKQSQFGNQTKTLTEKEEQIVILENQLKLLKEADNKEPILSDLHSFLNKNLQTEQDWKDFKHYFTSVHKDFFKTLKSTYPKLTTYDLNLCAFIKLNLHNKEIAQILGISPLSVKKARQRLFKKMNIESSESLVNYIIQL
ncbi:MAG: tetratricopeptide repeat protein [Saprospiraceae bacterium]